MRKTTQFPAEDGRDKGKLFLITEMSAKRCEEWAMKVLLALLASNVQLPEGFDSLGAAALAELGFKALAGIKWEALEPLLAEMMACVQFIGDPKRTAATTRDLLDDDINQDIEEVSTRLKLRVAVWKLHMDFLEAVAPSLRERAKVAAANRSRIAQSQK